MRACGRCDGVRVVRESQQEWLSFTMGVIDPQGRGGSIFAIIPPLPEAWAF